ncbi:hypothetical protein BLL52_2695 [Rhodoferax antarcticus ANT.BR]|uniref:Uncharacterized protein n=1 Tax=Rhodoferax antarcticus ANT.BR TaxID=1111071 RepID=A0A1Q8YEW9_9BURK|nr:hypothetical protein BLL52_2695 [Rhodoferax antarcticus ANT.BR]
MAAFSVDNVLICPMTSHSYPRPKAIAGRAQGLPQDAAFQ